MSLKGARCPICTAQFAKGEVSALRCGHTYHNECIKLWLEKNRTCPNCRAKTTERDVIKQLYFDIDDLDTSILAEPAQDIDPSHQIEELKTSLNRANTEVAELKHNATSSNSKISELNAQITKLTGIIAKRDSKSLNDAETIRKLEYNIDIWKDKNKLVVSENNELKKTQAYLEGSLKASEFYKVIAKSTGEENVTEAYRKYINPNGDPIIESFLNIQKKKCNQYRGELVKNQNELKEREIELQQLKDEKRKLENLVKALTNECIETRESNNKVNTPYNPKLKSMLVNRSPIKRISMGFNETINLDIDTFESAIKKPTLKKNYSAQDFAVTVPNKNKDIFIAKDLNHFCELYENRAIPVVETVDNDKSVIDKGDGIVIAKSTYESRNSSVSDTLPPLSIIQKAHIRMENIKMEVDEIADSRTIRTNFDIPPKKTCVRGSSKKSNKKVTKSSKEDSRDLPRLSQFFPRRKPHEIPPKKPLTMTEIIQID